jgi:hypothetical protein
MREAFVCGSAGGKTCTDNELIMKKSFEMLEMSFRLHTKGCRSLEFWLEQREKEEQGQEQAIA